MIAFGPVPSRRLGRSLGINNIPPKVCTYSCVYCQLGRTMRMQVDRKSFYAPEVIAQSVTDKVREAQDAGEHIDYLTFVADGEPTLDENLGREIDLLRELDIKIAVITNGSLVWREDVTQDLSKADWVSMKVDSVDEAVWRRMDRPYGTLRFGTILAGMREFSVSYHNALVTETMLVEDVNDGAEDLVRIGDFLRQLNPDTAYIAIPTRPPAEDWVRCPDEKRINRAYQILDDRVPKVEYLVGYEGDTFASTGNVRDDLLSITAVHPMKRQAVREFLARTGADWSLVEDLIAEGKLVDVEYENDRFYLRRMEHVPGRR